MTDMQQKLFEGLPPDAMRQSVEEQKIRPARVQFDSLSHRHNTNHCDVVFLDELCQEIRSLMKTSPSKATVLVKLTISLTTSKQFNLHMTKVMVGSETRMGPN
jgi:hypothetical protein